MTDWFSAYSILCGTIYSHKCWKEIEDFVEKVPLYIIFNLLNGTWK